MNLPEDLSLRGFWGGRVEPLETQAGMVWDYLQRLTGRGGFLANPWISLNVQPLTNKILDTFESLLEDMTQSNVTRGTSYGFCQDVDTRIPQPARYASLSLRLALPRLDASRLGNDAILMMKRTRRAAPSEQLPVEWLLSMGAGMVRDYVDVWHPDWVALDCLSLVDLKPRPRAGKPGVGFVTWLAPWVADPKKLPRAPFKEEYHGGTLIGIRPDSQDPLGDGTTLAGKIYASGVLKPLPTIQPHE